MAKAKWAIAICASAFVITFGTQAAEVTAGAAVQYDAAYFAQFAPRTALDMVERVPSFALRKVDEERRGFAGAVGNVLIDGKQPSAKSQSIEDILQRIPASQVLRIEILRGAETAAESSRDSLLVNVVRTPSAGAGAWSAGFEYAQQDEPAPNGYLAWAGRIRNLEYGLGARTYGLRRELPGRRVVTNGAGDPTETIDERSPREFDEYALDGELASDVFGGRLRATGQIAGSRYAQANIHTKRSLDGALLGDELAPYSERKRTVEIGTNFESAIDEWQYTLAAVLTRNRFDADAVSTNRDPFELEQSEYRQSELRETGESIVRGTLERTLEGAHWLQIGIEGALNTLDADLALTGSFGGGPEFPIEVDNANMHVEETRGEAFVLHTWRGTSWTSETRIAAEFSQLDFSGDAEQIVDLSYLKPSFQLTRALGARHQLRARVSREVEQLDFADFASAASLSDDRIEGGNPDLVPQTAWRLELGADLRLGAQTALGVRAYHDWIDDVADFVALGNRPDQISAPGNIGEGELYGLQVTLALPLSPLIAGGTLKADVTLQDPSVTDPITGRERTISDFPRNKIDAEFRQDLHRYGMAWGVKYKYESSETSYWIDETDRNRKSPSLDVFVERNLVGSLKATLTFVSVQGSPELRRRARYDEDRNGTLLDVEETRRQPGRWWMLTFSGTL